MSDSNKALKEKLLSSRKNGFDRVDAAELEQMESYCRDYMAFLNAGKTERLCAAETVRLAEQAGYKPLTRGQALRAGDKVYVCNRGKSVLLAHIGSKPIAEGAQITAAHIDSPRLDLKPNPLYEDSELAYFKTHYYGGIRKYQWVTIPMELHGVAAMTDGTTVTVNIGADEGDPKLVITDLLPHLGGEQGKKPLSEAIPADFPDGDLNKPEFLNKDFHEDHLKNIFPELKDGDFDGFSENALLIDDVHTSDSYQWEYPQQTKEFWDMTNRILDTAVQGGCIAGSTCAPYLAGWLPTMGEYFVTTESSNVLYCNSVLGARGNGGGGATTMMTCICGRTPKWGLHFKENRHGTHVFCIHSKLESKLKWDMVGIAIGRRLSPNAIPVMVSHGTDSMPCRWNWHGAKH